MVHQWKLNGTSAAAGFLFTCQHPSSFCHFCLTFYLRIEKQGQFGFVCYFSFSCFILVIEAYENMMVFISLPLLQAIVKPIFYICFTIKHDKLESNLTLSW